MITRFVTSSVLFLFLACMAQGADFSKIPDVTKNLKKGQWVAYKTMGGGSQKQTITDVTGSGDDREITVSIEITMNGVTMPAQEQKVLVKDTKEAQQEAWKQAPDTKITDGKTSAGGKDYDAVIVETVQNGTTVTIYMSEKIPVTGIVKMEIQGMPEPIMVVDSFGE